MLYLCYNDFTVFSQQTLVLKEQYDVTVYVADVITSEKVVFLKVWISNFHLKVVCDECIVKDEFYCRLFSSRFQFLRYVGHTVAYHP